MPQSLIPPSAPPPRGRLAPSPTGRLHLGNAFAFLMAWLSIRSRRGTLILRMEDIDPDRSRPEYAAAIMEDLAWLGLSWDEGPDAGGPCGPYIQSERLDLYAALIDQLTARGLIYPCYCTRKELRLLASAPHVGDEGAPYPGTCRSLDASTQEALEQAGRRASLRLNTDAAANLLASLRLATEGASFRLAFTDAVLGPRRFSLDDCGGDFAVRRSDGVVAYQLAVAADDAAMGITEVVRGDDLLLSTPRQLLLFELMDRKPPSYAHVPLVHDDAGERLAKRHRSLELAALRGEGIPAGAVIGYLGYLAGCLDKAQRACPDDLLPSFSLAALSGLRLQLPIDITRVLRTL